MSLKLSKTNTPPYDYFSINSYGIGLNSITTDLILDYGDPIKYSGVIETYLIATDNVYTNISLSILYEEIGLNWFISYNPVDWFKALILPNMDSRSINIIKSIYFKSGMLNDGTVMDGTYTQCKVILVAKEIYK
jgi:hypothetical protein